MCKYCNIIWHHLLYISSSDIILYVSSISQYLYCAYRVKYTHRMWHATVEKWGHKVRQEREYFIGTATCFLIQHTPMLLMQPLAWLLPQLLSYLRQPPLILVVACCWCVVFALGLFTAGLYTVEKFWYTKGLSGHKVYKFALQRCKDQASPPWELASVSLLLFVVLFPC